MVCIINITEIAHSLGRISNKFIDSNHTISLDLKLISKIGEPCGARPAFPRPVVCAPALGSLAILGWLPPDFLASSLPSQSLFDPLPLSRLEIKGMFLRVFYDVFL